MAKLTLLSNPQKKVVETIAAFHVAYGLAAHLKKEGCADTDIIVSNWLDSCTPKQNQIIRAYRKCVLNTHREMAKAFDKEKRNGTA